MSAEQTFSADALAAMNGEDGRPIYLSVKGIVYDVTKGADFYGPGKGYGVFAGKEVSRCLGKMEVNDKEANAGWRNLSEEHVKTLNEWEARFVAKYPVVGKFEADPHFEMRGVAFDP